MLENIKNVLLFKTVDKNIKENNFEEALRKLNFLITEEFNISKTFLKRGLLCKKLLMYEDAYSDFTYIINHCAEKSKAYYERVFLNFELGNFYEAISDADVLLSENPTSQEIQRIKVLSMIYVNMVKDAINYLKQMFDNKYSIIQFLLNETAKVLIKDEHLKGLKTLEIIEIIDKDNPIKLLKEANIYALTGDKEKEQNCLNWLESTFPKYFISHFKYTDMYQEKNLLELSFLLELEVFDKNSLFSYSFKIIEGFKNKIEGHILDAKESFEKAIEINPYKPEAYVLLAQTYQIMSGYDNADYNILAEENYKKALDIYIKEKNDIKIEEMRRQLQHLESKNFLKI